MRKEIFNKITQVLAFLILTVILAGIANTACNTHMHILPSGEIIIHAHPIQSSEKSHSHSAFELLALDAEESEPVGIFNFTLFFVDHLLSVLQTPCEQKIEALLFFSLKGRAPPF